MFYGQGAFSAHHNSNYRSVINSRRNLILRFKFPKPSVQWITWLLQIMPHLRSRLYLTHPTYLEAILQYSAHFHSPRLKAKRLSARFQNCLTTDVFVLYLALRGSSTFGCLALTWETEKKFPRWGKWKQTTDALFLWSDLKIKHSVTTCFGTRVKCKCCL